MTITEILESIAAHRPKPEFFRVSPGLYQRIVTEIKPASDAKVLEMARSGSIWPADAIRYVEDPNLSGESWAADYGLSELEKRKVR